MASLQPSPGSVPTVISSTLPEAPSTALLNRVKQDLNLEVDAIDIDLINAPIIEPTRREPRTYKALDSTVYIEILVKKEKGKGRTG